MDLRGRTGILWEQSDRQVTGSDETVNVRGYVRLLDPCINKVLGHAGITLLSLHIAFYFQSGSRIS